MDKKFYWLRLKRDFFKRHDTRILEDMPNGKDYLLFYLKLLVEGIDHEGNLRFSDTIPYNDNMLATITNTNVDIVRTGVKVLAELGLMTILEDGTIYLEEVARMTGSETYWAEKKRLERSEKKVETGQCPTDVQLLSNASPTCPGKSKSKIKSKSKNIYTPFFQNKEVENLFNEFLNVRKKLKAQNTDRAIQLLVNELNKAKNDDDKIKMIENSIKNSWKSVYPLKAETNNPKPVLKNNKTGKYDDLYE